VTATEAAPAPIIAAVDGGRLCGAENIGMKVGKVLNKAKVTEHLEVAITGTTLVVTRQQVSIDTEAALDGIYVLRATIGAGQLNASGVVDACKDLAHGERDFRHITIDDIDLCPTHHRLEGRVRSHVCIRMLAACLVWHLREVRAPPAFTDEEPPRRDNPVAPAVRSVDARAKAAKKESRSGSGIRRFEGSSTTSPP